MGRASRTAFLARMVLAAGAILLGSVPSMPAGTLGQREVGVALERALEAMREGRSTDRGALQDALAQLRVQHAAATRRFETAGARPLPAEAAQRLAAAREAHGRGQSKLVELIANALEAQTLPEQARLLADARALHERIEAASLSRPSSVDARVRPPRIVAPPLPVSSGTIASEGPVQPVVGAVPETLREVATGLAGPIEIVEWVRNEMRPEFYHGRMKGALQAFEERSGNDVDTASVLVEMLRARGIPARYARGVIELPATTLVSLTGTANIQQALRVLVRAGVPHEAMPGPGGTSAVRLHRVWVEAYLPYANYRGALIDGQGSLWLSLDAALKSLGAPNGLDVVGTLGFDVRSFLDQYLASPHESTPLQLARSRIEALLAAQLPGTSYESVLNQRAFESERLGLLPSTLPYKVVLLAGVSYDVDQDLRHRLRLRGEDEAGELFELSVETADALGRRVTLAYEPDTEDDARVVASYGGMHLTPPYLIRVRPVLKIGGLPVASGSRGIGMAVRYRLRLDLVSPGGVESIENEVQAGNLVALGLSGRLPSSSETGTLAADRILASVAARYFEKWNASDDELAALLRVVPVRPTLSACLALSDVEVEYAGGDPLYPLTFDWKGILIDADLRASSPVGLEGPEAESRFLVLSGLEGSVQEDRVFSTHLGIGAVSTARVLGLAAAQGPVLDVTQENVDEVLPGLPFDAAVKAEIRDAALRGRLVRIPSDFVTRQAWTGVGYLLLDEETGEAAWQLQGGHSGGVTTPAVIEIPEDIRDPLIEQGQSIEPAPQDSEVRSIQKFISTDFQEGTVNERLARPLRVLVTDEEGRAVRDAHVVFSVIGGGSVLQDPGVGGPASEVTVRSNERGEAEVTQILGTRTDVIPRLLILPDEELEPVQVGLNLVTARGGTAVLAEPFTSIALPDYQLDEITNTVTGHFEWMPYPDPLVMPQLSVAARMGLWVRDQHGNPLSNFRIRFTFRPPPEQQPPPPGMSLTRPATNTPGRVLTAADYLACLEVHLHPNYGDCAGEAPSVQVRSTHVGTFAYASLGDSPWSIYYYDAATTLEPIGWSGFLTATYLCAYPVATMCAGYEAPYEPSIVTGVRPVRTNRLGNFIEAYPPDGEARFAMWAESVSEVERVEVQTDPDGTPHFVAVGTNAWRRERLSDSEVRLTPQTQGTSVSPDVAASLGNGTYEAQMRMSLEPQLNALGYQAKHWPLRLDYLDGDWPELDPAHVNIVTLEAQRIQFRDLPIQTSGGFQLWGIAPNLSDLSPSPVKVGAQGTVSEASTIVGRVEPPAYSALLAPQDVLFEVRRDGEAVLVANGTSGSFQVPVGLPFPDDLHDARLSVVGVSLTSEGYQPVSSPPLPLPRCGLLELQTPFVSIAMMVDEVNATTCAQEGILKFRLCEAARVTLRVDGEVYEGELTQDAPTVRFENLELPAGRYSVAFPPTFLGPNVLGQKPFVLEAASVVDPSRHEAAPGTIANSARNRAVLPVGRTFVKGVDLFDGHVVRSHADLEVPGRHLGLTVQRTYSSVGADRAGLLGAGWAFSYESRLVVTSCGVIVQTADGSSQVFRSTDGGETFVPQRGYHTRLQKNGDFSWDFFDKADNRHHFLRPDALSEDGEQRLEYIEESHGDRLVLAYDLTPRLIHVREVHPDSATPVRQLDFTYVKKGGFDRISGIREPSLHLEVLYKYDDWGNLKEVSRNGPPLWRERYEYTSANVKDRHQLVEVEDANGQATAYQYYGGSDQFPGQGAAPMVIDNKEYVRRVVETAGGAGASVVTEFGYDLTEVLAQLHWQTTVRDGRGIDTLYVLNRHGGDLERHEAVGTPRKRKTLTDWSETDIFKTRSVDDAGRETFYGHDAKGNLTSETIVTPDLGSVQRGWTYGPFNKVVSQTDAAGRQTTWDVDPTNGDVLSRTDAAGNTTRFEYQDGNHGLVEREIDPRGHFIEHSEHDSFGNARRLAGPAERVAQRDFDVRGRLRSESDNLGHRLEQEWDGLDRLTDRRRVAGGGSDEHYHWEYYPAGQKRAETNPLGARTEYMLDGLARVVLEQTPVANGILTIERSYDANGNVLFERDRRGVRRAWTYDELNRATEMRVVGGPASGPTGIVARYGYDSVDRKLFEIDLAGSRSDFEHDGLYRIRKKLLPETCPGGRCFEEYQYDLAGNRTLFRDISGDTETTSYDGLNRVSSTTDRAGRSWSISYQDPEGSHLNKSRESDPHGLVTTFLYDHLNRETQRSVSLTGGGSQGEVYTTTTEYGTRGRTAVITDPRGGRTLRELDGLDRVTRDVVDVDALGLEALFTWDGLSNRTIIRDPEHHTATNVFDSLGRLVAVEDAVGRRTTFEYDGGGQRTSETDRRGVRTEMTYDNIGRLVRTEVVPSVTGVPWSVSTAYEDQARRRIETDPRGKDTVVELDRLGRVVRSTDPDGKVTRVEWLGLNDRREQDKRGNWRELRFDGIGRPTLVRDPVPFESQTLITSYDDAGNRLTETDRRGISRVTQMDSLQRVRSVARAGIVQDSHDYDENGNRVSSQDGTGHETRFEFDAANRMISRTDGFGTPEATITRYEHDRDGNVTQERDQRAADLGEPFSVRRTYDALHRLETVTDGEAHVTAYAHDAEGHRTSVTEPGLQVTTFEYGERGELTLVRQPAASTHGPAETRVLYDAARQPLRQVDARGNAVEMTWDDLGRLDRRTQLGATDGDLVTDPSYDANGNQTEVVDAKGQIVGQTFDSLNRVQARTWTFAPNDPYRPWRHTTSMGYTWDPNGNLLRVEEAVASGAMVQGALTSPSRGSDRPDR